MYNQLQIREIFHLEFLRYFGRKVKAAFYVLKGGVNLRFFFNSFRYSEDMDLDIRDVGVQVLRDLVMNILTSKSFQDSIMVHTIERVIPPDIKKAKQTETTQRFKVHLITSSGKDLFTKIEFSRRGMGNGVVVQPVSDIILRQYKLPPLLVPHYNIQTAVIQKICAISSRSVIQARDVFDLYILSSQLEGFEVEVINKDKLRKAYEKVFEVSFEQFRDTVLFYLTDEDKDMYNTAGLWDEVRLKVANFINRLRR